MSTKIPNYSIDTKKTNGFTKFISFIAGTFFLVVTITIIVTALNTADVEKNTAQATDQPQWLSIEQINARDATRLRALEALRVHPTEENAARRERLEIECAVPLTQQEKAELKALTRLVASKKATDAEEKRCYQLITQREYVTLKKISEQ